MEHITSAGIIVYYMQDNQPLYLLLHYNAGHWDFSKGHLDPGEGLMDAAMRELHEETGLTASSVAGFHETFSYKLNNPKTGKEVIKNVHFFLGRVDSLDVHLSHEHQNYQWLPYQKAVDQLTYDNAREVLCKVRTYLESIS